MRRASHKPCYDTGILPIWREKKLWSSKYKAHNSYTLGVQVSNSASPIPVPPFMWVAKEMLLAKVTGYCDFGKSWKRSLYYGGRGTIKSTGKDWNWLAKRPETSTTGITSEFFRIGRGQKSSTLTLGNSQQPQMKPSQGLPAYHILWSNFSIKQFSAPCKRCFLQKSPLKMYKLTTDQRHNSKM